MEKSQEFKFNWPILGHQNIVKYLQKSIITKQFVNSYLFFGPEEIGKKTLVNLFVKSIFCFQNQSSKIFPCNQCRDCQDFNRNIHPDYIELNLKEDSKEENKKNISIEQVRELKEKLYLTATRSIYKIAVINQADLLSSEAANALLKLIEEPPQNSIIILITEKVDNILPTIRSRTQNIIFQNVSLSEIYNYLLENGASKSLAQELSQYSNGVPGVAISYYQNPSLWTNRKNSLTEMLDILNDSLDEKLKWVEQQVKLSKKSRNQYIFFETLLNSYLRLVRDLVVFQLNSEVELIHPFLRKLITQISKKYQSSELLNLYKNLWVGKRMLGQNVNPKIIFENLFLI